MTYHPFRLGHAGMNAQDPDTMILAFLAECNGKSFAAPRWPLFRQYSDSWIVGCPPDDIHYDARLAFFHMAIEKT